MKFIGKLLKNSLGVVIGAYLLKGVQVDDSFWSVVLVALVIGFLNSFVKPLIIILTIPLTIFTFGLFLLVINAGIILLADILLEDFSVDNFWWALLFSFIVSIINVLFSNADKSKQYYQKKH